MKRLLQFSCCCFLLIGVANLYPKARACGFSDVPDFGYDFIDPSIVQTPEGFTRYFLRHDDLFEDFLSDTLQEMTNAAEWHRRLCEDAELTDVEYLIYQASRSDLELLHSATRSEDANPPRGLANNTAAFYLIDHGCTETIDYLLYTRAVQPYVVRMSPWDIEEQRDSGKMQDLIERGKRELKAAKSDYLRLRYTYQIVRLAHYMNDFRQAMALYESFTKKYEPQESIINNWLLGHYAGALKGAGNNVEASYLYSKIFMESPGRRESAWRSFELNSEEEWQQALNLALTNEERAAFYVLRANEQSGQLIEELQSIHDLDPTNPFLETILLSELRYLEENLLGREWNESPRYRADASLTSYAIELGRFVRKIRGAGRVARPEFWHLAEGYLELLSEDYVGAINTFEEVAPKLNNAQLEQQLAAWRVVLTIARIDTASTANEERLYRLRADDRNFRRFADFPKFLRDKLVYLYQTSDQRGKAFLSRYQLSDLRANPREEIMDDLLQLVRKPEPTAIERLLMESAGERLNYALYDLQATRYIQEGQFEAALEMMKRIPRDDWDRYGVFDPFVPSLRDCINCEHSRDTAELYNRGELLERLLELDYEARAEPERAARNFYRIGVALYNMTYFGHSWDAADHFRSGRSWYNLQDNPGGVMSAAEYAFGNKEHLDLSQAEFYLQKARILARNPELAAAATIWLAKVDWANFYQSPYYRNPGRDVIPRLPEPFDKHYQLLTEFHAETNAYQRLISECKFFAAYVR